jgi:rhamnosyltransferase
LKLKNKKPKIAVLLATYNGIPWLSEQLNSILNQLEVDVKIFVSDDKSTDGTVELLERVAENDARITVLTTKQKFGSAAKNFYRLIVDADISDCDYVAFSDQDDIWLENKLASLAEIADEANADGVSSNVLAFWLDGRQALIDKASPLRRLDFLFESAGPGCTFLMTPWLIQSTKSLLTDQNEKVSQVKAHDWLMYAICRSSGKRWVIAPTPTVMYRQHDNNELGVHKGLSASWRRLQKLNSGWYKAEVIKICELCLQLTDDAFLKQACALITSNTTFYRLKLLKYINHYRRSITDRIFFAFAIIFRFYK